MLANGKTPDGENLNDDQKKVLQMRVSNFSRQLPDFKQTHIVLPEVTFDDSLSLY